MLDPFIVEAATNFADHGVKNSDYREWVFLSGWFAVAVKSYLDYRSHRRIAGLLTEIKARLPRLPKEDSCRPKT